MMFFSKQFLNILIYFGMQWILISGQSICRQDVTTFPGIIMSPNFPSNYGNNLNCRWTLHAPTGSVIELTFTDIDIEVKDTDDTCLDQIMVYDGYEGATSLFTHFCGSGPIWPRFPTRVISTSNILTISMTSNDINVARGFSANYIQVLSREELIFVTEVTSPSIVLFNRLRKNVTIIHLHNALHPSGIDVDPLQRKIYFTDTTSKLIGRIGFYGSNQETLIQSDIETPNDIAVGYISDLLYWTDAGLGQISVSRLDGSRRSVLISSNCNEPRSLLLGNNQQYIYWTCYDNDSAKIERAFADGKNRMTLVDAFIIAPKSMTIDRTKNRLFWIDVIKETVDSCNLEGGDRKRVFTSPLFLNAFSLELDSFAYFFTEPTETRLIIADRISGDVTAIRTGTASTYEGVAYFNSEDDLQGQNGCTINNGGCGLELCLPSPTGQSCGDVSPNTSPYITCPAPFSVTSLANNFGNFVNWENPICTDQEDGTLQSTCDPSSGTRFQIIGPNTITCTCTDSGNLSTQCMFVVTIIPQNTSPEITCPAPFSVTSLVNNIGNYVNWPTLNCIDQEDGVIQSTCDPSSSSFFPGIGTTVVTCTCSDSDYIRVECQFIVTIIAQNTPPGITCPESFTVTSLGNNFGDFVNWESPICADQEDGALQSTCDPLSNTLFTILGPNTITCTCTDSGNLDKQCVFVVNIIPPNTSPVISCPAPLRVISLANNVGNTATWTNPTCIDQEDGLIQSTCDHSSEVTYFQDLGPNIVTCTCVDSGAISVECQFVVTIIDPIEVPCLTDISKITTNNSPSRVFWTLPDSPSELPFFSISHGSGSFFNIGQTEVTVTYLNTEISEHVSCSFTVTVILIDIPCPADVNKESVDNYPIPVNWTLPDSPSILRFTRISHMSGSYFNIGQTEVTVTYLNTESSQQVYCSFTVTLDLIAPIEVPCPEDVNKITTDHSPTTVNWTLPDSPSALTFITISHSSGSNFNIGQTEVILTYLNIDISKHVSCSFTVTVVLIGQSSVMMTSQSTTTSQPIQTTTTFTPGVDITKYIPYAIAAFVAIVGVVCLSVFGYMSGWCTCCCKKHNLNAEQDIPINPYDTGNRIPVDGAGGIDPPPAYTSRINCQRNLNDIAPEEGTYDAIK